MKESIYPIVLLFGVLIIVLGSVVIGSIPSDDNSSMGEVVEIIQDDSGERILVVKDTQGHIHYVVG